jgi:outer membrane receptor for ferrienterochelin and colicins
MTDQQVLTFGGELRRNKFQRSAALDLPDQDAGGFFVQHEWNIGEQFTVMSAVRVDCVEDIEAAVSPKLSLLYSPELPLRLRGSVSRGFHAPTLQELHEEGYGHGGAALRFGNSDLDPEYSMTYSAGLEVFPVERLLFAVYGHYSDIDDMIIPVYEGAWVEDPTKDVWRRENIEHAKVLGVEATACYLVFDWLRLEGGYTWTDTEDEQSGHQLPYDPGASVFAKAVAEWDLTPDWNISGFVGLRAVFDRRAWNWKPEAGAPVGDPSGYITELEDYEKLDAGVALAFKEDLSVYLNVYNILRQDMEFLDDAFTVVEKETTFKLGVRWEY